MKTRKVKSKTSKFPLREVINSLYEDTPSRDDAYKEGLNRKRRHEKNIVWKAKIFAAGAMWAKMKITGISDVIGNDR